MIKKKVIIIAKKESNNKRVLIILLVFIATLLAIIVCIVHILITLKKNNVIEDISFKPNSYIVDNSEEFTITEVLKSLECKDISYSLKKDGNDYYYDIYLSFKHNLYDNDESQKEYFDNIVRIMNYKLKNPYKLTDYKKNIEIYADTRNGIYTINGVDNFYNNNSYVEVNSHVKKERGASSKNSKELGYVFRNGWKRDNLNLTIKPKSIDSKWIDYDSFKMNYSDININYVIFNENYKGKVINEIEVGQSLADIKKIMGEPEFNYLDKMIGYKMNDCYIFCYEDEIVIYPDLRFNNYKFEEKVYEYYSGNYKGYRTKFVLEILEQYNDFESKIIDNGVKLYSYRRGIELDLYDDDTMDITVYGNYNFYSKLKILAEVGKTNLKLDDDFIYLYEIDRNN